jgi:DNA-binding CsgD family transcriptional regulator
MSVTETSPLRGREEERAALGRLVSDVRGGRSGVLVLRGEPGVGKTALLEDMCDRADGVLLIRGAGIESEAELAFAGLHHMCSQMIQEKLDLLPDPQRDAIRIAFGESAGGPADPFLIGLAVLSRLADMAEEQPVVCVVDDAQWLDRATAQTLAFVARRLEAEAVGIVFAVRESTAQLDGLPEFVVSGLAAEDARQLLHTTLAAPLDHAVRERFIAETHGNPLALLELPRGRDPAELAGGFGLQDSLGVPTRVEESFQRRLEQLPPDTRLLMLAAAAEPTGDPMLLWRATGKLGIAPAAAAPAESAGLLELGVRVAFRHPLVRSAVYRTAAVEERRRVHRALGDATDPEIEPDRRAWHYGHGASGADEDIAAALERSAGRAQARGGLAATAAFLKRAVELTEDPTARGRRGLAAAQAKLAAGAPAEASDLLSIVEASPLDELGRARLDMSRAQVAFAVNRGSDTPPLLLAAAKRLEDLDPPLARDVYSEALRAAIHVGPLNGGSGIVEAADAFRAGPQAQPGSAYDELMDGTALVVTEGFAAGFPLIKRALIAFRFADNLKGLAQAVQAANVVSDYESLDVISRRQVELARDSGALTALVMALVQRSGALLVRGDLAAAGSLIAEAEAMSSATGIPLPSYGAVTLAAYRGREAEAAQVFARSRDSFTTRGEGIGLIHIQWAGAVLNNGLCHYAEALDAAVEASARPREFAFGNWGLVELIEAAVRNGDRERGDDALHELLPITRASGTDWALGLEARSRALLSDGAAAEQLYEEAIQAFSRAGTGFSLARAHLVYGEWLRRGGRRADAREQLRRAHRMFEAFGTEAFAARTVRELAATGERVRKQTPATADQLTPQETQIAKLAAEGYSNRDIGGQLFISHRTVGYHLSKVFMKLDVKNRAQLHGALDGADLAPAGD